MQGSRRFAAFGMGVLVTVGLLAGSSARGAQLELVGQAGQDFHLFSKQEYHGYRNAALALVVSPEGWKGFGFEVRAEYLWGTIRLGPDQTPPDWDGTGPKTTQLDHWMAGLMPLWRGRIWKGLEFEGGLGVTWLDRRILAGGTRWNFLLMAGFRWRFAGGEHPLAVGLRFEHFSNGGDIGFTDDEVIGLESLALAVSWRFGG